MKSWWKQVHLMEIRKMLAYRVDFWVNFLGQIGFSLVIAYFLWLALFTESGQTEIKGKTMEYMIFYYLIAPLFLRVVQGQGIGFIAREIYDGQLNKFLLYPINVFQYKLVTYLTYSFFYMTQLLAILCLYQVFYHQADVYNFSLLNICLFLGFASLSAILFFFMFMIPELLAFWFDNTWSLGVILRFVTSLLGGVLIPLTFFPEWSVKIIYMTPFPYLVDYPMRILLGTYTMTELVFNAVLTIAWAIVFAFISVYIWKRGKDVYSGVGI